MLITSEDRVDSEQARLLHHYFVEVGEDGRRRVGQALCPGLIFLPRELHA
jgi:hypothetical protein